ncbi:MAG: T9SS type A sorting domain-containing protein, partial [Candidatus Krumholzibacteria bacterium]|nr:T9SS type A sorting domain-containing protein [Candidatus Krumholzibacteria bacterium]
AGGGVSLTWSLPASIYGLFDLSRAVAGEGGMPGEFGVVASGRSVGLDGTLRYVDKGALAGERYVYQLKSAESGGVVYTTGEIYVPVTAGSLSQNYPNPFNPTTQITYYLPEGGLGPVTVSLVVYDVRGARVRTLVDATSTGGKYTVEWDGRNDHGQSVGSGVYFYRLVGQNFTRTRKMLLLK